MKFKINFRSVCMLISVLVWLSASAAFGNADSNTPDTPGGEQGAETTLATVESTSGPVAHWRFEEGSGTTTVDSAGGVTGTIHGAQWHSGILGGGLVFDGLDDYVECADPFAAVTAGATKTITAWARTDTGDYSSQLASQGRILTLHRSDNYTGFSILIRGNPAQWSGIYATGSNDWGYVDSAVTAVAGEWTHIALVQSGSEVTLYLDGTVRNTEYDVSLPVMNAPADAVIGAYNGGDIGIRHFFNGAIDDVRIYDRALGGEEVRQVYEQAFPEPVEYFVDGVNGNDQNDGLSEATAFATISRGIAAAEDGNVVSVFPAVYMEDVVFLGKAITLRGLATPAGIPVIEAPGGFGTSFYYGEGPESVFRNFVIRGCDTGVFIAASSPTVQNLTLVGNAVGIGSYGASEPDVHSNILWNNHEADLVGLEPLYSWTGAGPPEGLVSYWSFNESGGNVAADSIGPNDGYVSGAAWAPGQAGSALSFDGEDDHVDCGNDSSLNITTEITIAAWINTRTLSAPNPRQRQSIVSKYDSEQGKRAYDFSFEDTQQNWCPDRLVLTISSTGGSFTGGVLCSDITLQPHRWYHVAARFRGGQFMEIYVDGTDHTAGSFAEGSLPSGIAVNDLDLRIGYGYNAPYYHFDGLIDEVAIFDRALSPGEIAELYQMGLSGRGIETPSPMFADEWYHLRSQRGRYWPRFHVWALDEITSPCVDGGDPLLHPGAEPMPNGGRLNMGAYGGTAFASMSEWPLPADVNFDGAVNGRDLAILAASWLESLDWAY